MMQKGMETVVARILQPGEEILWTGRPNVEAVMGEHSRHSWLWGLAGLAVAVAVTIGISRKYDLSLLPTALPFDPRFLLVLAIPFLLPALAHVLKLDARSRLERHFRSLTYAMTDRRLLVLEGERLQVIVRGSKVASFTPEQMHELRVRERVPGYVDVIFARYPRRGGSSGSGDPVVRERCFVGFKAQSDAGEITQRIEGWIDDRIQDAAREVAGFVESASSAGPNERPTGSRRVEHPVFGLRLDVPVAWKTEVRYKEEPFGKTFFDKEYWSEAGETDSWNLVKSQGRMHCGIEVEIFETEPTLTYDNLAHSRIADATDGEVVESDPAYEINGLRGFTVTRRDDLQRDPESNSAGVGGAVVASVRRTVLYEGRLQIVIVSTWPERSPDLRRTVDAVERSVGLTRASDEPARLG